MRVTLPFSLFVIIIIFRFVLVTTLERTESDEKFVSNDEEYESNVMKYATKDGIRKFL